MAVWAIEHAYQVALRKESVDRNTKTVALEDPESVALRKESVDRNGKFRNPSRPGKMSLSARRAWIEIVVSACAPSANGVALRKESVDRNT